MIRTGFKPPARIDPKTGEVRFSTFKKPVKAMLGTTKPIERTAMKRKARRAKPGDEPKYKAWIRLQPCVVGGELCGPADPHHVIDGHGGARKGMGQTAPDRFLLSMCRAHHNQFHAGTGFCKGWSDGKRREFQMQEVERFRAIWRDLQDLDVLQEPQRKAV